ncbi:MAG: undecaprenyl-diphosphate phosphatase [bacterium]
MDEYLQAFFLALLQGLTEFLPISSSGHLALAPRLFGWADQGLAFDVAAHVGTLIAVVVYFRAEVRRLIGDWLANVAGGAATAHSKLAWAILFATVLIGLAGVLLHDWVAGALRHPVAVASATAGFGALLGLADWLGAKRRGIDQMNWKDVVVIGCAQVLALIPGASRAGVTISAALAMGLSREAAARFSFLLAMPVIALAGLWQTRELIAHGGAARWDLMLFAVAVSGAVALLCIHGFLIFLRRHSLLPFVLYRIALGAIVLLALV